MRLNKFTDVSYSRLAEVYTSALRDGIAGMFTESYRTNEGHILFIEPLEHRMEAIVNWTTAIRLHYEEDNKTWNRAEFGDMYPIGDTARKMETLLNIYQWIKAERNIYCSDYKHS